MGEGYERHVDTAGGHLVARAFADGFREQWFDPDFWGADAVPVSAGGRGSAWFVSSGADDLVLRHFCRGGLPGRFIRREYFFNGADSTRSFAEFRLLHELFQRGFPVPEPVAAGFSRLALVLYRAALIVRRIRDARPLSDFSQTDHGDTWYAAGRVVRRFHDAGVFHADLNCMNILVADQVYLIDFDRGRIMPENRDERWKTSNISRLERSVNKLLASIAPEVREKLWQSFLQGYRQTAQ